MSHRGKRNLGQFHRLKSIKPMRIRRLTSRRTTPTRAWEESAPLNLLLPTASCTSSKKHFDVVGLFGVPTFSAWPTSSCMFLKARCRRALCRLRPDSHFPHRGSRQSRFRVACVVRCFFAPRPNFILKRFKLEFFDFLVSFFHRKLQIELYCFEPERWGRK